MSDWKTYLTAFISTSLILTVLILTLTHGGFQCEAQTSEGLENCSGLGITETQDQICDGTVFYLSATNPTATITILCPWSTATLCLTVLGSLIGIVFVVMSLCRKVMRFSIMLPFRRLFGLGCLVLMLISPILMIVNLGGGGAKCREFHDDLGDNENNAHCSNVNYGVTFILELVSLCVFGIQVFRKDVEGESYDYVNEEYGKEESLSRFNAIAN